jgi:hypothetical protein
MKRFKTFFFIFTVVFLKSVDAGVIKNLDSDSLKEISKKLTEIDQRLQGQKLSIEAAIFHWNELDQFKSDLLYTVAYDPTGPKTKDAPEQMDPVVLTSKLKASWGQIESQVLEMGELENKEEWVSLKAEVENFFSLRHKFYYQPARALIKSGSLLDKMQKLKQAAASIAKDSIRTKSVGLKVMDPVLEKLNFELGGLSKSMQTLIELNAPAPEKPATIFDSQYLVQIWVFGFVIVCLSSLATFFGIKAYTKYLEENKSGPAVPVKAGVNYYDWLKRFESNLQTLKRSEEDLSEYFVELRAMVERLSVAHKNINEASGQQEYYKAIDLLNEIVPQMEERFLKQNPRKQTDASRKIIAQVIQICEAIENKKDFYFDEHKPHLRLVKLEQTLHAKSA